MNRFLLNSTNYNIYVLYIISHINYNTHLRANMSRSENAVKLYIHKQRRVGLKKSGPFLVPKSCQNRRLCFMNKYNRGSGKRIYSRFEHWSTEDCACIHCVNYAGRGKSCPLDKCCIEDIKQEAINRESAKPKQKA